MLCLMHITGSFAVLRAVRKWGPLLAAASELPLVELAQALARGETRVLRGELAQVALRNARLARLGSGLGVAAPLPIGERRNGRTDRLMFEHGEPPQLAHYRFAHLFIIRRVERRERETTLFFDHGRLVTIDAKLPRYEHHFGGTPARG